MANTINVSNQLNDSGDMDLDDENENNISSSSHHLNSKSSSNNNSRIAIDFKNELNSVLDSKPPISKEKINNIVKEAIKAIRNYKHVVYYVEIFIKNCSPEYKIPGLYILDAIIRSSKTDKTQPKHNKDLYLKRFSKNMCKTFTNLYNKCPGVDRERITRVLQLWQKYNILDAEMLDKLNKIASTARLDSALSEANSSTAVQPDGHPTVSNSHNHKSKSHKKNDFEKLKKLKHLQQKIFKQQERQGEHGVKENFSNSLITDKTSNSTLPDGPKASTQATASHCDNNNKNFLNKIDNNLINEINKLTSELLNKSSKKKIKSSSPQVTTKSEISQLLDSDSDSDSDTKLKHKSPAKHDPFNMLSSSSERFKTSISNCAAWIQSNNSTLIPQRGSESNDKSTIKINLPDLTQPPPPLLHLAPPPPPPPLPPLPPPPPPPSSLLSSGKSEHELKKQLKEKERERSKRGLPSLRDKHLCIASKTLWLGHLAKSTTEEYVIDEIIELLSPSSSNDAADRLKSSSSKRNKNYQTIIVDVHLIPPRGCAYVEFVDRKMAAKCLDRLKDGYRLDGNYIKVAWATNKGINKDRRIKQYWNVDNGCTFIPWTELTTIKVNTNDFLKWAEGGLVDEDSIPEKHLESYKKLMLQNSANTADSNTSKAADGAINGKEEIKTTQDHDMDLDTDDDHEKLNAQINQHSISGSGLDSSQQQQQTQLFQTSFQQPPMLPPNTALFKIPIQLQSTPSGLIQNNFNPQLQFAQTLAQVQPGLAKTLPPYLNTINPFANSMGLAGVHNQAQFFNPNQVLQGGVSLAPPPPPPPPSSSPSTLQKANASQFQHIHFQQLNNSLDVSLATDNQSKDLNCGENKSVNMDDTANNSNNISSTTIVNGTANNTSTPTPPNANFNIKPLLPIYQSSQIPQSGTPAVSILGSSLQSLANHGLMSSTLQQTHLVDLFKHQQNLENNLAGVRQFNIANTPNTHLIPHFQLIQRPILMSKPTSGKPGLPPNAAALNSNLLRHINLMQASGANPAAIHFQTMPLQSQGLNEEEFKSVLGAHQQATSPPSTLLQNTTQFSDLSQFNNNQIFLPIQHFPLGSNVKFLNSNEINSNESSNLKNPNEDERQSQSLSTTSNLMLPKPLSLMDMSFESKKNDNSNTDSIEQPQENPYESRGSKETDYNNDRHRNDPNKYQNGSSWRNNNRRYSNIKPDVASSAMSGNNKYSSNYKNDTPNKSYNNNSSNWINKPRSYNNNNYNNGNSRSGYERSRYSDRQARDAQHGADLEISNGYDHQRNKD